MTTALTEVLSTSRVILCVGAGGVGKTTLSASLAMVAAIRGRSALVCTIDPAKRLSQALGLSTLGNQAAQVDLSGLPDSPIKGGRLDAMLLDMKRSWDELIASRAPAQLQARIFQNRFYQSLSSALAGSQEYIALEKLGELAQSTTHDLLVLDTPPTQNAMDFFRAPRRILDFLNNPGARWFLKPALAAGRTGLKLFQWGGQFVSNALARFTGADTLQQLAEFMLSMGEMNEVFVERAQQTERLLRDAKTHFVVVTTPTAERVRETVELWKLLQAQGMHVAAVVINRTQDAVLPEAKRQALSVPTEWTAAATETLDEMSAWHVQHARLVDELTAACAPCPVLTLPDFDVQTEDLTHIHRCGVRLV